MRLYGTRTSPFVRRVRVLALELGEPCTLVDTSTPEGKLALDAVSPLGKVPVAEIDGVVWLDSRVISDRLVAARGRGPLREPLPDDDNLRSVADGALDALINVFYLVKRDGVDPATPYLVKQRERADLSFAWLAARLHGTTFDRRARAGAGWGLPEIALATALGWCRFREMWDAGRSPPLAAFLAHWDQRASFAATLPPAA